jgi:hypothetical protein
MIKKQNESYLYKYWLSLFPNFMTSFVIFMFPCINPVRTLFCVLSDVYHKTRWVQRIKTVLFLPTIFWDKRQCYYSKKEYFCKKSQLKYYKNVILSYYETFFILQRSIAMSKEDCWTIIWPKFKRFKCTRMLWKFSNNLSLYCKINSYDVSVWKFSLA